MIYIIEKNTYSIFQNVAVACIAKNLLAIEVIPYINLDSFKSSIDILNEKNVQYKRISIAEILLNANIKLQSKTLMMKEHLWREGDWEKLYEYIQNHSKKNSYVFSRNKNNLQAWIYVCLTGKKILRKFEKNIGSLMIFLEEDITLDEFEFLQRQISQNYGDDFGRGFFFAENSVSFSVLMKYYIYNILPKTDKKAFLCNTLKKEESNLSKLTLKDLQNKYEYFHITGHSNGIDMDCGEAVICGKRKLAIGKGLRVPPCFFGNVCNRKGNKINPEEIDSSIVFLYTCWGILFSDAMYSLEIALSTNFVNSMKNAVYISTSQKSVLDNNAGELIYEYLIQGYSVGKAVNEYNKYHYSRFHDTSMSLIVLGDPDYTGYFKVNPQIEHKEYSFCELKMDTKISILYLMFFLVDVCNENIRNSEYQMIMEKTRKYLMILMKFKLLMDNGIEKNIIVDYRKLYFTILRNYQSSWIKSYILLVQILGGAIYLNYDKYLKKFSNNFLLQKCDNCNGKSRKKVDYLEKFFTKRTIRECPSCGEYFEGFGKISDGKLICKRFMTLGINEVEITMRLDSLGEDASAVYSFCVCLEPFAKDGNEKISLYSEYGLELHEKILDIKIEKFLVEEDTCQGAHYLNVMVIVDEEISIFRRIVYMEMRDDNERRY